MKLPLVVSILLAGVASAAPPVTVISPPNRGQVPDAEVAQDGSIHVASVAGEDAFYARSNDGGKSFSAPLRINSAAGTVHPSNAYRGPDLALAPDGTVHVIWYENSYQRKRPKDEWGVYYSRLRRGAAAFEPARNLNHLPSDNYSLAVGPSGDVAVFWMAGGLFLSESNDGGTTFAPAKKIDGADTCECCGSRAAFAADGTLVCAYRDKAANYRDMHLALRALQAGAFHVEPLAGESWSLNACPMTGCSLVRNGAALAAAWQRMNTLSFARLDSAGKKLPPGEITIESAGGKYPLVLTTTDGTACLSWKEGTMLHWRLFSADGKRLPEKGERPSSNPNRHAGIVTKDSAFLLID